MQIQFVSPMTVAGTERTDCTYTGRATDDCKVARLRQGNVLFHVHCHQLTAKYRTSNVLWLLNCATSR